MNELCKHNTVFVLHRVRDYNVSVESVGRRVQTSEKQTIFAILLRAEGV